MRRAAGEGRRAISGGQRTKAKERQPMRQERHERGTSEGRQAAIDERGAGSGGVPGGESRSTVCPKLTCDRVCPWHIETRVSETRGLDYASIAALPPFETTRRSSSSCAQCSSPCFRASGGTLAARQCGGPEAPQEAPERLPSCAPTKPREERSFGTWRKDAWVCVQTQLTGAGPVQALAAARRPRRSEYRHEFSDSA